MLLHRRDFIQCCLAIGAASVFAGRRLARVQLNISGVGNGGIDSPMFRGLLLGVEEAQRAAALFGNEVEVRGPLSGDVIIPDNHVSAWIVSTTAGDRRDSFIEMARRTGGIVFNVDDPGDALRSCQRHIFHLWPGAAARRFVAGEAEVGQAVATWDPSLTRFGADTLNKRYRARYGAPMTSEAWCGWFAVKCVWEATLQSKARNAGDVISYLEQPTSRFDGHKGSPLWFDGRHELVQPLYLVRDGVVTTESIPATRNESAGRASPDCGWR